MNDFNAALNAFVDGANALRDEYFGKHFPNVPREELIIKDGRKYAKITVEGRSVWAFINKENGDILKPASWAKPAKHARGNIFNADPLANVSPYGPAYLRG